MVKQKRRKKRLKKIGKIVFGSDTYKSLWRYYGSEEYLERLQRGLR